MILYPSKNNKKNQKNIKFDLKRYFDKKIMFTNLDQLFELSNLKYGRKTHKVLCFVKHHSLTLKLFTHDVNKYISTYFDSCKMFSMNYISILDNVVKIVISELCEPLYLSTECFICW
jgi:hypothetical protein